MRLRIEEQMKRLAAIAGVMALAAAEALAQDESSRPARRILVSIPDRKLAVLEDDRVVKIYQTAVGAPKSPSPVGSFTIVSQIPDPTWYGKGRVVPPGKSNPIGTRWMGLSQKGYGIHGTNVPSSIGKNASHGCIRMRNHEVEELFELVAVGDVVELVGERTPETERIFGTPATVILTARSEQPDRPAGVGASQE